jgi:hypothetical protein
MLFSLDPSIGNLYLADLLFRRQLKAFHPTEFSYALLGVDPLSAEHSALIVGVIVGAGD